MGIVATQAPRKLIKQVIGAIVLPQNQTILPVLTWNLFCTDIGAPSFHDLPNAAGPSASAGLTYHPSEGSVVRQVWSHKDWELIIYDTTGHMSFLSTLVLHGSCCPPRPMRSCGGRSRCMPCTHKSVHSLETLSVGSPNHISGLLANLPTFAPEGHMSFVILVRKFALCFGGRH